MNQIILKPKMYGNPLVIESRDLIFDVSDFLRKYYQYARKPSFATVEDTWRRFMQSNGGVGTLHKLKEKYGVKNFQHFYCSVDLLDGQLMALAHIELLKQFIEQQFDSPYNMEISLDDTGLNWRPERDLPLQPVSDDVSEAFISLAPGENFDDKVDWINNAVYMVAFGVGWESLPYVIIDNDEQKIIDNLCRDVASRIDSGEIESFEALNKHLAQMWLDKNVPSIFKSH